jgi:hypothetical protein
MDHNCGYVFERVCLIADFGQRPNRSVRVRLWIAPRRLGLIISEFNNKSTFKGTFKSQFEHRPFPCGG